MLLPVIVILAFIITFALATSFFFFFVETPMARRKMMHDVNRRPRFLNRRAPGESAS